MTVNNIPHLPTPQRPNETSPINIQGHLKIYDPKTNEVFIEKRA